MVAPSSRTAGSIHWRIAPSLQLALWTLAPRPNMRGREGAGRPSLSWYGVLPSCTTRYLLSQLCASQYLEYREETSRLPWGKSRGRASLSTRCAPCLMMLLPSWKLHLAIAASLEHTHDNRMRVVYGSHGFDSVWNMLGKSFLIPLVLDTIIIPSSRHRGPLHGNMDEY